MKAAQIVNRLLEVDPDEINPKREMLRVDPEADIKEIVHALQNEGILTLGYKRAANVLKLNIKLTDWLVDERVEEWVRAVVDDLGIEVPPGAITASNLGPDYEGKAYVVFIPLEGQQTRYTKLV